MNLAVARRLARLLEGCGATAVLTRSEGEVPTATAKVALAEAVGADWFLTIGRSAAGRQRLRPPPPRQHRRGPPGPGAPAGRRRPCCPAPARRWRRRGPTCCATPPAPPWNSGCPARPRAADELRLDRPAWQAAEARALLAGLAAAAADSALPTADPAAILPGLPGAPAPAAVTWALWDGNLPWYPLPPADGAASPTSISSWNEPGLPAAGPVHTLEVHTAAAWQLWRLERGPDGTWTGALVRAGATDTPQDD